MHPTHPSPMAAPGVIDIRFKTYVSVLYIVTGSIMTVSGVLVLLRDGLPIWVIVGPLLVAAGIVAGSKPYLSYDIAQGSMNMRGPFGNTVRTYGLPKGERIAYNGVHVVRLLPDGRQKKVSTGSGRDEDVSRLIHYLASMQQQPPAPYQG